MTLESYIAFCAAAAALALVPGPTVTVIIANSLRYGAKAGMINVAGTQAGFLVWLAIAALGLGMAIQAMGIWFDLLRLAIRSMRCWRAGQGLSCRVLASARWKSPAAAFSWAAAYGWRCAVAEFSRHPEFSG